jgi:enamine deaminase RidA (YjgF/YER057c/UK114 family)
MEERMPAQSGNRPMRKDSIIYIEDSLSSRISQLEIVLPAPPTPLGFYVESSDAGNLLFLSGMLPVVNGKLSISRRLGESISIKQGQEAAHIASLNTLAAAKQHLGNLDRLTADFIATDLRYT